MELRSALARYPSDPAVTGLVGEVTVDCDPMALTDRDPHLVLSRASAPAEPGAEALVLLNVLGAGDHVRQCSRSGAPQNGGMGEWSPAVAPRAAARRR